MATWIFNDDANRYNPEDDSTYIYGGTVGNDIMYGLGGDDSLSGGKGDDQIFGGDGSDELHGEEGNDLLDGGNGSDYLDGVYGNNTLIGGKGDDFYSVRSAGDVVVEKNKAGHDRVMTTVDDYTMTAYVEDLFLREWATKATGNKEDNYIRGTEGGGMSRYMVNYDLDGGAGNDIVEGNVGDDNLFGDKGNDILLGLGGYDNLFGGDGNDELIGGDDDDWLVGGAGDDFLDGDDSLGRHNIRAFGNDDMRGGAGNDTYVVNSEFDYVSENKYDDNNRWIGWDAGGVDTIISSIDIDLNWLDGQFENVTLTGEDDLIVTGNHVNNVLRGNAGNNELSGEDGTDILYGGDGNDRLDGGGGNDTLYGGAGNDWLANTRDWNGKDKMYGGEGDDFYNVDNKGDKVVELDEPGIDTVISQIDYSLGKNVENLELIDSARMGKGNELDNQILVSIEDNELPSGEVFGHWGNDVQLYGYDGDDILAGGWGWDNLYGGDGNDFLVGNSGGDFLDGGAGADILEGGEEGDTYILDHEGDLVIEDGMWGRDEIISSVTVDAGNSGNIEDITLTGTADINADGNNDDNNIWGNKGDNEIFGYDGWDNIWAGDGNDLVDAGDGGGDVWGGKGNDEIFGGEGQDYLFGEAGNDFLAGGGADDRLNGGDGDDHLHGEDGQDRLSGGKGEDFLWGDAENDRLYGEDGDDHLYGGDGGDKLDGGKGVDTMFGGLGKDRYFVDNVNDAVVEVDAEDHSLDDDFDTEWMVGDHVWSTVTYALPDNVEWLSLEGKKSLNGYGNDLNNEVWGNDGKNKLFGMGGDDQLGGNGGNDILYGGNGADNIMGDEGKDILYGYDVSGIDDGGYDHLDGGEGADKMYGGLGKDYYVVDNIKDLVVEVAEDHSEAPDEPMGDIIGSTISYTLPDHVEQIHLWGSANINATGNDMRHNYIEGNSGANILKGESDASFMDAINEFSPMAPTDHFVGHGGNDTYYVNNIWDNIQEWEHGVDEFGAPIEDDIFDSGGNDTVITSLDTFDLSEERFRVGESEEGEEILENLTFVGTGMREGFGNGLDNIMTGNGESRLFGGEGDDLYIVGSGDQVVEEFGEGIDTVQAFGDIEINQLDEAIENLFLDGKAISGFANEQDNLLTGNAKNNILYGGWGNDVLNGDKGSDTMIGGDGDDDYWVDNSRDKVQELNLYERKGGGGYDSEASDGYDRVFSTVSFTLSENVEELRLYGTGNSKGTGNDLENIIIGNSRNNVLSGKGDSDHLEGGAGNDTLLGGDMHDTLIGDSGNDTLKGEDGYDFLIGGEGNDKLTGGADFDIFYFNSALDAKYNKDTITDFTIGEDNIELYSEIFSGLDTDGNLLAGSSFISGTKLPGADEMDEQAYILYNTKSGGLYYDRDGSGEGAAVQFATLSKSPDELSSDDIIVSGPGPIPT